VEKYKKTLGAYGEEAAAAFLKKKGYRILKRNYFVRGGEIDIIAQKGSYVVFVEVKTRRNKALGTGAEAVTYTKQQRLRQAAAHFLLSYGDSDVRFDVVEVYGSIQNGAFRLEEICHLKNAF
jgi:putative endonuclease